MARLIQKSGYIKNGKASGYMEYVATRDGVEIIQSTEPVTKKQEQFIQKLLKDFPDAKELFVDVGLALDEACNILGGLLAFEEGCRLLVHDVEDVPIDFTVRYSRQSSAWGFECVRVDIRGSVRASR